jgi:BirA family transcriptional regulator, biotin operon repressor / biotin---[acetyl-CoA-carboxylase] ligase
MTFTIGVACMKHFKPKILRYESLPSTNTEVARLASQGWEEGLSVIADEQTAGRGRLHRSWLSPKGAGLYFSILLRPKIPQDQWPLITFMAALAASEALFEAAELQTDIKWPNDLLAGERKVCGILAEAIETETGRAVVVGIGINLTGDAFPDELADAATSVAEATGRRADREAILAALLRALARWYSLLHEVDGPEKIVAAWTSKSSYAQGKFVRVTSGDRTFLGTTRGVEKQGALRVETEAEVVELVRAGDVVSVRPSGNTSN